MQKLTRIEKFYHIQIFFNDGAHSWSHFGLDGYFGWLVFGSLYLSARLQGNLKKF